MLQKVKMATYSAETSSPMSLDLNSQELLTTDRQSSQNEESQYRYQWTDEDLQLMVAHRNYHKDMLEFIEQLEVYGPNHLVIPKKPRQKLESLQDKQNQLQMFFVVKPYMII